MDALPAAEIWEFYGASEGGVSRISPEEWRERPGSVGRPWPGVEVTIRGEEGEILGPGETGLVYMTSPGGRFRYHQDPDKDRRLPGRATATRSVTSAISTRTVTCS